MRDCFSIDKIKEYTEDKKVPFSVHWTLTENCNLRCLHCYMAKKPRYVTLNDAEYIVPFIKEKGFLKITLSGGECMLNPDFTSIYKLLKRAGFLISIITNGTVFSAEIKNLFREYPPYEFYISIYGDDESSFQKATGKLIQITLPSQLCWSPVHVWESLPYNGQFPVVSGMPRLHPDGYRQDFQPHWQSQLCRPKYLPFWD